MTHGTGTSHVTVLDSLFDLAPQLGPWLYLIVFAVAAAEAALFVGLVVPGETLLIIAGVLASRGTGSVWLYMLAAVLGAIAGDSLGYELGRHLGPRLKESRVGGWVGEKRWDKADGYLQEKGGRAVFFGRWVSVVRAIVPALAGQARMPYRKFLAWNVAGAIPVGVVHVGIGYLAGESYKKIESKLGIGQWVLLGLVVIGGLVWWFLHHRSDDENEENDEGSGRDREADGQVLRT